MSKTRRIISVIALLAAGNLTAPGAIGQDATKIHRIGFINVGPAAPNASNVEAFRTGLRDLGYVEGRNIVIDFDGATKRSKRCLVW